MIVGDRRQESPDATSPIILTTHHGVWIRIRIRNRGIPRGYARKGVRYLAMKSADRMKLLRRTAISFATLELDRALFRVARYRECLTTVFA